MRPLRLKLRNFRSFLGEHIIRFDRDHNLVTVVGDIGSGKSTLLDGVCYALYGVTPTIGRPDISQLIHNGKTSAQVALLFETVDGELWEAVRTIGVNASHSLYRRTPNGDTLQTITLKQHVDERIGKLVGLDYPSFGRAVMLAQGRFAEMLRASQTEREATLRSIMGLGRLRNMRKAAKRHRDRLAGEEHKLEQSILVRGPARDELEKVTERLNETVRLLETAGARVGRWETLQAETSAVTVELSQTGERLEAARLLLDSLHRTNPNSLEAEHQRLAGLTEQLTARVDRAQRRCDRASEHLGSERVQQAERVETETGRLEHTIDTTEGTLTDHVRRLDLLETETGELPARLESVTERLNEARRHTRDAAAGRLRADLSPGDPCPVCTRPAPQNLPPTRRSHQGDEQLVERLAAEKGQLEERIQTAHREHQRLDTLITTTRTRLADTRARLDEHRRTLTELIGDDTVAGLRGNLQTLIGEHTRARERLQQHENTTTSVRDEYEQALGLRDRTVALLNIPVDTLTGAEQALTEDTRQQATRQRSLQKQLATINEEQQQMVEDCGGQAPPLAEASLRTETTSLAAHRQRLRTHVDELDRLEKELSDVRRTHQTYQTIYGDLADHRMVRWLLEGERVRLAAAADQHMRRLTDNKYGIATRDGDLMIVDGDTLRDPATLSGGETFLASLALAFGLGETITRSAHPIRCFFLDEGFGSLDSAHIDQALDGVEQMAMGDQLVVLVSHLQAVKERAENTIQLVRAPAGHTRQAGIW